MEPIKCIRRALSRICFEAAYRAGYLPVNMDAVMDRLDNYQIKPQELDHYLPKNVLGGFPELFLTRNSLLSAVAGEINSFEEDPRNKTLPEGEKADALKSRLKERIIKVLSS